MTWRRITRISKGFVYLVRYADDNTIEGYAKTKKDFREWLSAHNKERREEGSCIEHADEFELQEIEELNKYTEG